MMRISKLALVVVGLGGIGSAARADDGSWARNFDLAQGPLYAVTENPDVSLDRELLTLENFLTGQVTARFELTNTSDRAVTVDAGFPVVLDMQLEPGVERKPGRVTWADPERKGGKPVFLVPYGKYGGNVDPALLRSAGLKVRKRKPDSGAVDEEMELGDYYVRAGDFAKKRIELPVPKKPPFDFSIEQDGKPVVLTSMVIERDPAGRPPIVFHFRHQLRFAPRATSVVTIRYQAPTLYSGGISMVPEADYEWHYILRTGSTWKGPLGKMVLEVPLGGECRGRDAWTALGRWGGYELLGRTRFEPTAADDIRCRWRHDPDGEWAWDSFWFETAPSSQEWKKSWEQARRPAPDVRNISASSEVKYKADVYPEWGVVTGAPNSAAAAFDGIVETAWSEGDKKSDVGQYLEFELTRPAAGLRIMAGFLGALHAVSGDAAGKKKQKLLANLYRWNSRPKRLELVAVDGSRKWTLDLKDEKGVWNVFPILVPAGKYRLVIQDTYKGSRWQDTSIGEVQFDTGSITCLERLRKDPFFGRYFADGKPYLQPYATVDRDE